MSEHRYGLLLVEQSMLSPYPVNKSLAFGDFKTLLQRKIEMWNISQKTRQKLSLFFLPPCRVDCVSGECHQCPYEAKVQTDVITSARGVFRRLSARRGFILINF